MDGKQMDSQQTFSDLIQKLDYVSSPSLVSDENVPAELEITWQEAKDRLHIDAVYFVANAPIIYFKQFDALDYKSIIQLHRNVWNQSKVPLLFVILPNDIRVYNGYETPKQVNGEFSEPSRLDYELISKDKRLPEHLWERLAIFTRTAIDSGTFWRYYGDYFSRGMRADQQLMANLGYIRRQLLETQPKLVPEHAHSLIGRSIFALYLQDRGVLTTGRDGFFARELGARYSRYTDLLLSHKDTYAFFDILRKFNGDMFPVTPEEKEAVHPEHLELLHRLFTVDSTVGGQMLFFWAYDFEFIPIELISSIYEEFLYQEESGKDGTYYTPLMLVDFMLNQAMPWNDHSYGLTILDPACGSGIFLVEAYRRLVERWRKSNGRKPKTGELIEILKHSIFGIDIQRQALRVAAFSLYLTMLDYIEPKSIWMEVQFPPLIGTNLIEADFFDEERVDFAGRRFDLVIGNPPWVSKLTSPAKVFLRSHRYKVGDEQIVQAFLWHAPDFCAPHGQIALLSSSKSLLFNKSNTNISFRRDFFRRFRVEKVFDFSALRRFLFDKGIAPASAIFYTPQKPVSTASIFYGAPKLTHLARRFAAIVIEANDLKQLPLNQVWDSIDSMSNVTNKSISIPVKQTALFDDEEDEEEIPYRSINIWKVALWGTSYDYILLQTLDKYPSLLEVIAARGWQSGAGFIRSGSDEPQYCWWLDKAPFLNAKHFTRYGIDTNKLTTLPEKALYHRGRRTSIFKAPLVLFKRGQAQRRPSAAYLDRNCTYTDAITGIAGPTEDRDLLKALAALLNSELAQYYLFLTSASWGVEREEIKAGEMRTLPFPFLNLSKEQLKSITTLVDELSILEIDKSRQHHIPLFQSTVDEIEETIERLEYKLNQLIYECFGLDEQEIQHIYETVQYTIGFFNNFTNSKALENSSIEMRKSYAASYIKSINFYLEPVGRKLTSAVVHTDESIPLYAVKFSLRTLDDKIPDIQEIPSNRYLNEALSGLNQISTESLSEMNYHRRNFKIYEDGSTFYIIKPTERRLWTVGAALSDVEETIAELI